MPKKFNKNRLKSFIARRRINALGLTIITAASALITLICAMTGFKRTEILIAVTLMLMLLCLLQAYKNRKSFRTMKSFKGWRKRKSSSEH